MGIRYCHIISHFIYGGNIRKNRITSICRFHKKRSGSRKQIICTVRWFYKVKEGDYRLYAGRIQARFSPFLRCNPGIILIIST